MGPIEGQPHDDRPEMQQAAAPLLGSRGCFGDALLENWGYRHSLPGHRRRSAPSGGSRSPPASWWTSWCRPRVCRDTSQESSRNIVERCRERIRTVEYSRNMVQGATLCCRGTGSGRRSSAKRKFGNLIRTPRQNYNFHEFCKREAWTVECFTRRTGSGT